MYDNKKIKFIFPLCLAPESLPSQKPNINKYDNVAAVLYKNISAYGIGKPNNERQGIAPNKNSPNAMPE